MDRKEIWSERGRPNHFCKLKGVLYCTVFGSRCTRCNVHFRPVVWSQGRYLRGTTLDRHYEPLLANAFRFPWRAKDCHFDDAGHHAAGHHQYANPEGPDLSKHASVLWAAEKEVKHRRQLHCAAHVSRAPAGGFESLAPCAYHRHRGQSGTSCAALRGLGEPQGAQRGARDSGNLTEHWCMCDAVGVCLFAQSISKRPWECEHECEGQYRWKA